MGCKKTLVCLRDWVEVSGIEFAAFSEFIGFYRGKDKYRNAYVCS